MTKFSPVDYLLGILEKIPDDAPIFGQLENGKIKMPKEELDGRILTWRKFITNIDTKIENNPQDENWCWFVPSNAEDGYHVSKLSKDGSINKWKTIRILYLLFHPYDTQLQDKYTLGDFAHRCFWGKGDEIGDICCINPRHSHGLVSSLENQDHKGCKYGCKALLSS